MKIANTKFEGGKVQLGELTGGKMDDITVLVAMVEEADLQVGDFCDDFFLLFCDKGMTLSLSLSGSQG